MPADFNTIAQQIFQQLQSSGAALNPKPVDTGGGFLGTLANVVQQPGVSDALLNAGINILSSQEQGLTTPGILANAVNGFQTGINDSRKRQTDYQTTALNNLLVTQKIVESMSQEKLPFEGTSFDAQSANEQYKQYRAAGYSDADSRILALNDVREAQISIDPNTGYQVRGQRLPVISPLGGGNLGVLQTPIQNALSPLMQSQGPPLPGQQISPLGNDPNIMNSPAVQAPLAVERGKNEIKNEFDLPKLSRSFQDARDQKRVVIKSIDELLNTKGLVDAFSTGTGSLLKYLPGSDATTVDATLETIRSNIATDKLQRLRENSPTGGALGNSSDKDIELLAASKGKIRQDLKPEVLLKSLQEIRQDLIKSDIDAATAYERDTGQTAPGDPIGAITPLPSFNDAIRQELKRRGL